jgi:hypothetical protein
MSRMYQFRPDYRSEACPVSKVPEASWGSLRRRATRLIRPLPVMLLVLSLLLGMAPLLRPLAAPQSPDHGAAATSSVRNAAVVAATQAVLKETSVIRELPVLRPVRSGAQSRVEIERTIIRNLNEQSTPAEMHATEVTLKKLGLAPADFQYRPFVIKLLTEQVAGYYDPKVQEFFLADWLDLEGQKPVMAHELTHALQDQHFNLRRFEKWSRGDSDAELAAHALIEGDATLAMTFYMARNPMVALAFMRSLGSTETSSEEFKKAPRALRESLLFPYEAGLTWTSHLYHRGGWSLVSKAFRDLPQSSEQILHPEKYFAREVPVRVTLPDIGSYLGTGWKQIDSDVNGEWSFYLMLDEFLKAKAESQKAAAGWAGDRYLVYEEPSQRDCFIAQASAWDRETDAQEFFDAYAKRTLLRYPEAQAETGRAEKGVIRRAWETDQGRVVMEKKGNQVIVLEGLPTNSNERLLLKVLWRAREASGSSRRRAA